MLELTEVRGTEHRGDVTLCEVPRDRRLFVNGGVLDLTLQVGVKLFPRLRAQKPCKIFDDLGVLKISAQLLACRRHNAPVKIPRVNEVFGGDHNVLVLGLR